MSAFSKYTGQIFSTAYSITEDGGLEFVVATLEDGVVFRMQLDHEEAMNNLQAFADTFGVLVSRPL